MNTYGKLFRVSIFGESHGEGTGVVIDGVKPGISLSVADFEADLARRRSGAPGTTPRREPDLPEILSGVYEGHTTGAPLTLLFRNTNTRPGDYERLRDVPRPGHADFTAGIKYGGFQDPRGGGHFSGRLTLPVVGAGVIAKKMLSEALGEPFCCNARIKELGGLADESQWAQALAAAQAEGDSLGAVVECVTEGIPAGVGEPFWDSVESCIAHTVFAVPGVRGIEFGDGFAASRMRGSEHNDVLSPSPATHHAGGVNGGISNGGPLVFRVAFKPTSSIARAQKTWDFAAGRLTELRVGGRHDICFALRTPVIVEAVTAIVLVDLLRRR